MAFSLPELPYAYEALEPHIDAETMHLHHDKHHQTYVTNLNAALEGTEWADWPLETVLDKLNQAPEEKRLAMRNNGGGHYNHSLFWDLMTPGGATEPTGALLEALTRNFGSVTSLKEQVNKAGTTRFGSGWAWLCQDEDKTLHITSTPNQDNPLMEGAHHTPLLGIDVWEHAYYLKYQNRRPDYLAAWWSVLNWDKVAVRFKE